MKVRRSRVAATIALAASLSACETSPSLQRVAALQSPAYPLHSGTVRTARDCGDDNGGFGAPVRHLGDPTPFSENPFSACWPR